MRSRLGLGIGVVVTASAMAGVLAGVGTLLQPVPRAGVGGVAFQPAGESAAQPATTLTPQQQAARYWQAQQWEQSAAAYADLTAEQPDAPLFAFRHAYSLHALGKYEEALAAHERAAKFPQFRGVASYNAACASALLARPDAAFRWLDAAVNAGFRDAGQIVGDADLASLHADERWTRYVEALESLSGGHAMAFWVGNWEVRDASGTVVGKNIITSEHNGNVIREEWMDASGRGGTSINFLDWRSGLWRQVWVDGAGGIVDISGGPREDGAVVLEGDRAVGPSVVTRTRTTFTVLDDGRVRQLIETSADGVAWRVGFDGYYTRIEGGQAPITPPAQTVGS